FGEWSLRHESRKTSLSMCEETNMKRKVQPKGFGRQDHNLATILRSNTKQTRLSKGDGS
ncbi:unnamed protein product, partial [marine sediment metagenome]